ncbi:YfcE family phosphodiesterase [Candidatus Woesearchaeota archaeon]|nr:YfcE family phosphodiesterase [Candidatus Woesearchaeota archaeon]
MIVILSDTHEHVEVLKKALKKIKKLKPELIIHLGDLICPPMLDFFKDYKDFRLVFGNCDGEKQGLRAKAKAYGWDEPKEFLNFEFENKKFFAAHQPHKTESAIETQRYDYVLHGHTHNARDEKNGKTRIINPGALYWTKKYTFASLNPKTDELKFIKV